MGRTYTLGKEEAILNLNSKLIFERKSEDYDWIEVTYKSDNKEIFIGSVFSYNYGGAKEWIEYNENLVVLAKKQYGYLKENLDELYYLDDDNFGYIGPYIKKMFDINNEIFIDRPNEELVELYCDEFNKINDSLVRKLQKD